MTELSMIEARIKALEIASTAISELTTSDCTNSPKVKDELGEISIELSLRADSLKENWKLMD